MNEEKFMLISLDDSKAKSLADVLGSGSCKKIINYLAENEEASQKDLSDALGMPINTVEYNVKKLLESGLIYKRSNFFWSKKGKKIVMYGLSNKSIVISPRKSISEKMKSLLPAFMLTIAGTFSAFVYEKITRMSEMGRQVSEDVMVKSADFMVESTNVASSALGPEVADFAMENGRELLYYPPSPLWVWFLAGGLLVMFVFALFNWKKL